MHSILVSAWKTSNWPSLRNQRATSDGCFHNTQQNPHISYDLCGGLHYLCTGKHHQAYLDNMNKQVAGSNMESKSLEEVVLESWNSGSPTPVFNNAAQVCAASSNSRRGENIRKCANHVHVHWQRVCGLQPHVQLLNILGLAVRPEELACAIHVSSRLVLLSSAPLHHAGHVHPHLAT